MNIICFFCFFGTFGNRFKIKLIIHGSILNLTCVNMSELEVFHYKGIFVQNSNTPILLNLQNLLRKTKEFNIKSKQSHQRLHHTILFLNYVL
jgi:hypothetical protein